MKSESPDKLILSHLNINSILNKFDEVKFVIATNVDVISLSETKCDNSFPVAQFFNREFWNSLQT